MLGAFLHEICRLTSAIKRCTAMQRSAQPWEHGKQARHVSWVSRSWWDLHQDRTAASTLRLWHPHLY